MSSIREPRQASVRGPQCAYCGGVIGTHEPAVHVVAGIASFTSRAVEPELPAGSPGLLYHAPCYEIGRQDRRRVSRL
jgi:hypothetical protein